MAKGSLVAPWAVVAERDGLTLSACSQEGVILVRIDGSFKANPRKCFELVCVGLLFLFQLCQPNNRRYISLFLHFPPLFLILLSQDYSRRPEWDAQFRTWRAIEKVTEKIDVVQVGGSFFS